jgi:hypothetical protein
MKLEKILDQLNSFEKNSFLKIIDCILAEDPKNQSEVDKILSDSSRDLKNMDNINIVRIFNLLRGEFTEFLGGEFANTTSQLDILSDIILRDGNSIMKQDWFARLYEEKLKILDKKLKRFTKLFNEDTSPVSEHRRRDYQIYHSCLKTAYYNDDTNNQDRKITKDELSILVTLSLELGLSQEEIKLINYSVVPVVKKEIDTIINELKSLGVVFYSRKTNTIYVADEVVRILREIRGKEIADKFFRRVLRVLKNAHLNSICREHNIDWKLSPGQKVKEILNEGISFTGMLRDDIHKNGTSLSDKKKALTDLCNMGLKIQPAIKGTTLQAKIGNLIDYFEEVERDEKVSISIEGYEKLLIEMGACLPNLNQQIKTAFELQDENVLSSSYLLDYNLKPRDILEILPDKDIELFCSFKDISTRGDSIPNILNAYKDVENIYLENYASIGFRDLASLKENGIVVKEVALGSKFEELTKTLFNRLGFNVDEKLRKKLNTKKDKIDIVLNMGNEDLILIECKTVKESGYNKFSSVSRQLKAYANLAEKNGFKVIKSLLVAPDFSDEFAKDCGLEYELNLSLIAAPSLLKIVEGFRASKLKQFPYNLLMRDVLIQENRVIKAIEK